MNTFQFCLPWLHVILRIMLKGNRRSQFGLSCCQHGALSKARLLEYGGTWGVGGGGGMGVEFCRLGKTLPGLKSQHFPWTDQVGCDGGGGGGSLPPRTMEEKEQACMSWTKLTPCEIQRWLRACLGTIRLVWTPKLEGNWRAEQFPIHGENEEAEDLFNESAVGKGIYLQYYYLVAKNLLWPNVKSIFFFFDKLKRLRKISRFWQRMVCKREVLSVRIWHQLHFVMVKNISIIY